MQTAWESTDGWVPSVKIEQLRCYRATIKYLTIDDLRKESLPNGYRGIFQAGWLMDSDDSKRFAGQWAMLPAEGLLWVPSSELVDLEPVDSSEYYNGRRRWSRAMRGKSTEEKDEEEREEYKCPACRDTGLGPYDGMRCPACSPGGKAWRERMSGDDDRPGPDDGKEE